MLGEERESNMNNDALLVSGASGQLGRRVVELLLERDTGPVIATTRKPDTLKDLAARGVDVRHADFDQPSTLTAAFRGAGRALLVSTDTLDTPGKRIVQHRAAIAAFEASGVRHVVYTSLPNPVGSPILIAKDHAGTEEALSASRLGFTNLRNNVYADMLLFSLPQAVASGHLVTARGDGAVAYVTREDVARTAAAALADRAAKECRTLDVTGSEALTASAIAALVTEITGRRVQHVSVEPKELVAGMTAHGLPQALAEVYASFDIGIARGDLATVTDTVSRLTGRAPERLRDFLARKRGALLGK
jgi:NAD(P)H dehydrogenase (quinone)